MMTTTMTTMAVAAVAAIIMTTRNYGDDDNDGNKILRTASSKHISLSLNVSIQNIKKKN